ncbi:MULTISPECIES: hypothetical protein [Limnospira]|nr:MULTISPECIES: hypothetical protein [unclassified Limnospira]EKD08777.1 hypothetical protein SPLC1_S201780 [Arthrospira platensis C1]MDT9187980.1 hypothetical protein [Limnospira sp. PMC 894.15]MDT9275813.1 hypothetical protein [Limnospira sp. PMC 737.11]
MASIISTYFQFVNPIKVGFGGGFLRLLEVKKGDFEGFCGKTGGNVG